MQMKIIVESEEEYQAWLESQQTFSQTIASMGE
jgi:cytochrome c oxidase subunit 2